MSITDLPAINASLNFLSAVFLLAGLVAIRRGQRDLHRKFMVSALATSVVFLVGYLVYHGLHGSTLFLRQGGIRSLYFFILITHVVLAAVNLPMVIVTVWRAWKADFVRHRKIAKITWGLWMYVSITGVVVYLMLYQLFPGPGP